LVNISLVVIVRKTLPGMVTGRARVHPDAANQMGGTAMRPNSLNDTLRNNETARLIARRGFLKGSLSLGALTLLTGCDVTHTDEVQAVLNGMSQWNDRIQAALFNPHRLMPTYTEQEAVKDFRYNAYYGEDRVPKLDGASYRLILSGLVENRNPWSLPELYALPQTSQITRLVCVEGWSMIGKWSGVPFRTFLERIG